MRYFRWLLALVVLLPIPAAALTLIPPCATGNGTCYTCDFITLFANWAELILIGISSIVMLMIAIGGFFWILSAGNPERVQKGRGIMVAAIVGLFFVMFGYLLVNVTIGALLGADDLSDVQLYATDWATYCESGTSPSGALTTCTEQDDGKQCNIGSCTASGSCFCLDTRCVTGCEDSAAKSTSTTISASGSCISSSTSATSCAGDTQTLNTTPALCPTDQVCCLTLTPL